MKITLSIECSKHSGGWIGYVKLRESRKSKEEIVQHGMKPIVELNTTKTLIMVETAVCLLYLVVKLENLRLISEKY